MLVVSARGGTAWALPSDCTLGSTPLAVAIAGMPASSTLAVSGPPGRAETRLTLVGSIGASCLADGGPAHATAVSAASGTPSRGEVALCCPALSADWATAPPPLADASHGVENSAAAWAATGGRRPLWGWADRDGASDAGMPSGGTTPPACAAASVACPLARPGSLGAPASVGDQAEADQAAEAPPEGLTASKLGMGRGDTCPPPPSGASRRAGGVATAFASSGAARIAGPAAAPAARAVRDPLLPAYITWCRRSRRAASAVAAWSTAESKASCGALAPSREAWTCGGQHRDGSSEWVSSAQQGSSRCGALELWVPGVRWIRAATRRKTAQPLSFSAVAAGCRASQRESPSQAGAYVAPLWQASQPADRQCRLVGFQRRGPARCPPQLARPHGGIAAHPACPGVSWLPATREVGTGARGRVLPCGGLGDRSGLRPQPWRSADTGQYGMALSGAGRAGTGRARVPSHGETGYFA